MKPGLIKGTIPINHLFSKNSEGLSFYVKVITKASQNRIGELLNESDKRTLLKIYLTTAPEGGKANRSLVSLLSKNWHFSKSQILIKQGLTDSYKKIQLLGDPDKLLDHMGCIFTNQE